MSSMNWCVVRWVGDYQTLFDGLRSSWWVLLFLDRPYTILRLPLSPSRTKTQLANTKHTTWLLVSTTTKDRQYQARCRDCSLWRLISAPLVFVASTAAVAMRRPWTLACDNTGFGDTPVSLLCGGL